MDIHLSIKAKLVVTPETKQELKSTMEEFNRACNNLSEMALQQDLHRKYDIHHAGYRLVREETSLPAQHVINAIAKVSAAYVREPNKLHQFKPHSSVRYDARTMVLGQDCYTASLTVCPKGRVTGQLHMSARMRKQLCQGEQGSLGVDLGVSRVAVTSNKKFHAAKNIRHTSANIRRRKSTGPKRFVPLSRGVKHET